MAALAPKLHWGRSRSVDLACWVSRMSALFLVCSSGCSAGSPPAAVANASDAADAAAENVQGPGDAQQTNEDLPLAQDGTNGDMAVDAFAEAPADEMSPVVPLCTRLDDPGHPDHINVLSQNVALEYLHLVALDCRVANLSSSNDTTFVFANQLRVFNLALWGCWSNPPADFGLVPEMIGELTSADVALLIDVYLQAAVIVLELSSGEVDALRGSLVDLGALAVTRNANAYALSLCDAGGAGAGDDARADAAE